MQLLISDANILIDADIGNLLNPMFSLGYQFGVPDILYYEELEERHPLLKTLGLQIMQLDPNLIKEVEKFARQPLKVSRNDLFAFVLARHHQCHLLTGDKHLRGLAESVGTIVHGTIWLVDEMLKKRKITLNAAHIAYDLMRANGSRLPWGEVEQNLSVFKEKQKLLTE